VQSAHASSHVLLPVLVLNLPDGQLSQIALVDPVERHGLVDEYAFPESHTGHAPQAVSHPAPLGLKEVSVADETWLVALNLPTRH